MKKRQKKSGINFNINLSNRAVFTILGVLILVLGGLSVYAYGTSNPSNFGHTSGEIASLDWSKLTNVPSGFADGVDNTGSGGITGYEVVRLSRGSNYIAASISVDCPSGKKVISGGCYSSSDNYLQDSYPWDDNFDGTYDSWRCDWSGSRIYKEGYAICVDE